MEATLAAQNIPDSNPSSPLRHTLLKQTGLLVVGLITGLLVAAAWSVAWTTHGPSSVGASSSTQPVAHLDASRTASSGALAASVALTTPAATETAPVLVANTVDALPPAQEASQTASTVDTKQDDHLLQAASFVSSTPKSASNHDAKPDRNEGAGLVSPPSVDRTDASQTEAATAPVASLQGEDVLQIQTPTILANWSADDANAGPFKDGALGASPAAQQLLASPEFCAADFVTVLSVTPGGQNSPNNGSLAVADGLQTASQLAALALKCSNKSAIDRPIFIAAITNDTATSTTLTLGWSSKSASARAVAWGLRDQLAPNTNMADCAILRVDARAIDTPFSTHQLLEDFCGQS